METESSREWQQELSLRRQGMALLLMGVAETILYGAVVILIIQYGSVLMLVLLSILAIVYCRTVVSRLRQARNSLKEAETIHRRREARLPRK